MRKPNKYNSNGSINKHYVEHLEAALRSIANPMRTLSEEAAKSGCKLTPAAHSIANDASTLKSWAKNAIAE